MIYIPPKDPKPFHFILMKIRRQAQQIETIMIIKDPTSRHFKRKYCSRNINAVPLLIVQDLNERA